jgi:hypothetical protein
MSIFEKLFGERASKGNLITNKSNIDVTVCCNEFGQGIFSVDLRPGQKQLITWKVRANVYPLGSKSFEDLKYHIGESEKWEVRTLQSELVLVKVI